uniref:hypothetical protein n=1 Tax=Jatropha curcas TaxID=180498 RepID=UPI00279D58CE|nr:hypothetical protein QLP06_mgp061 [Jatropha curcas]WFG81178.1 hypothetical protein [Jatropha curcas]
MEKPLSMRILRTSFYSSFLLNTIWLELLRFLYMLIVLATSRLPETRTFHHLCLFQRIFRKNLSILLSLYTSTPRLLLFWGSPTGIPVFMLYSKVREIVFFVVFSASP